MVNKKLRMLRRYCRDDLNKIENYDAAINDPEQIWDCHHRLEIFWWWTTSIETLKEQGLYYHRPASELIFLPRNEHTALHHLGKQIWKGRHHSKESKSKMSKAKIEWHKKAKLHWFNNGIIEKLVVDCPVGFIKGRLKNDKDKHIDRS